MQLPRGRFHRLLKSTKSRALIEEMGSERFTGICTIVLGSKSLILVLNEGQVVLAEYGGLKGQHALDMALEDGDSEAAAELNTLTPEQIQLALEFNKPFAVADSGKDLETPPSKGRSVRMKSQMGPGRVDMPSMPKRRPEPLVERRGIPTPGLKPVKEAKDPQPESDEISMLMQDMESLDIDQLVSDFRVNCKDILRKIHLDHLIQDKDT
ncbi:MAG: hypothetical protein GX186_01865 [Methanoculleus thermophilus]|jgi:hypothetical protein|uniref:Uncharacterized protein n=2 Tax=Methanomicrobiaceae TaxID=2194 RepID=A0A1G8YIE8_9EURY|nr:hypothetical protein [Methanoculleus thermophilus]SDK02427.1 hypothetical protein SAMN04488571_10333 [Methanoculleus thermophilus]HQD26018.1 hypothetical protein [Methanoculleus thermophilus]